MERLRKLKPSFPAIGSYCSRRATPNAADSSVGERFSKCKVDQVPSAADSLIRERFIKCKPRLPLIHQNLSRSCAFPSSSSRFAPNSAHPNPFSVGSKRFFVGDLLQYISPRKEVPVPYTRRKISLISSDYDRKLGEINFSEIEANCPISLKDKTELLKVKTEACTVYRQLKSGKLGQLTVSL